MWKSLSQRHPQRGIFCFCIEGIIFWGSCYSCSHRRTAGYGSGLGYCYRKFDSTEGNRGDPESEKVYETNIHFKIRDGSLTISCDKFDADKNYEAMTEELLLLANEQ